MKEWQLREVRRSSCDGSTGTAVWIQMPCAMLLNTRRKQRTADEAGNDSSYWVQRLGLRRRNAGRARAPSCSKRKCVYATGAASPFASVSVTTMNRAVSSASCFRYRTRSTSIVSTRAMQSGIGTLERSGLGMPNWTHVWVLMSIEASQPASRRNSYVSGRIKFSAGGI